MRTAESDNLDLNLTDLVEGLIAKDAEIKETLAHGLRHSSLEVLLANIEKHIKPY